MTPLPNPEVRHLMRELGLSEREATDRLTRSDLADMVGSEGKRQLRGRFAGVWCDLAEDAILVGVVGAPMDLSVLERDERLAGHLRQVPQQHSDAELAAVVADLAGPVQNSRTYFFPGAELPLNRVVVYRLDQPDEADATGSAVADNVATHAEIVQVRELAEPRKQLIRWRVPRRHRPDV